MAKCTCKICTVPGSGRLRAFCPRDPPENKLWWWSCWLQCKLRSQQKPAQQNTHTQIHAATKDPQHAKRTRNSLKLLLKKVVSCVASQHCATPTKMLCGHLPCSPATSCVRPSRARQPRCVLTHLCHCVCFPYQQHQHCHAAAWTALLCQAVQERC